MAESPAPTYRVIKEGESMRYVCLLEDQIYPSGHCEHWSTSFDLFKMHAEQRHGGVLIEEVNAPQAATGAAPRQTPQPSAPKE